MTFSLAARDPESGSFGMVVCSSSPAVASRCIHLRRGVGVVASQNVTNPGLGPAILDRLEQGLGSEDALSRTLQEEPFADYRQLSVVDDEGRTAHHSGENSLGINHWASADAAVAAGNLLASADTVDAMVEAYHAGRGSSLEARLMAGLQAALAAGGEAGPVRSAGLKVIDDVSWATTDLRVDDADEPVAELLRLWSLWEPVKNDYRTRALNPDEAPGFGVAGDLR
ncbi:DUF1028 domain-containing protein [Nesterenkonia sp. CL21]|uniref:DUF1028 domain-containing protein n=1 Tax=Nesterenkonia sp. CL21 TaxID=3064894 RepID=UPI00287A4AEF|nr:DUF1028 domain-containing protein [Nesterenkonia sp. CL21]MDS2173532.1 DUF1028 domain-containing protein [Nesterenkonia sp. CL21]